MKIGQNRRHVWDCCGEVLEFHDLCYLAVNTIAGSPVLGPHGHGPGQTVILSNKLMITMENHRFEYVSYL